MVYILERNLILVMFVGKIHTEGKYEDSYDSSPIWEMIIHMFPVIIHGYQVIVHVYRK